MMLARPRVEIWGGAGRWRGGGEAIREERDGRGNSGHPGALDVTPEGYTQSFEGANSSQPRAQRVPICLT